MSLDFIPGATYADAINAEVDRQIEQARDYGGFLAQAGVPLEEAQDLGPHQRYVTQGYARQLRDFPEG